MYANLSSYTIFPPREHFIDSDVINIIIYNPQQEYEREMKSILETYLQRHLRVKPFFVTLRPQTEKVEIEGNIMYIKGDETFIPGILHKTMEAIQYCKDHYPFDYIVRSNISTIIDFSTMNEYLVRSDYSGCMGLTLQGLDAPFGIHDNSLFGTRYLQGTHIVLTKNGVDHLLQNKHKLRYDIIDDVAIGLIMGPPTRLGKIVQNEESTGKTCYRNKSNNRKDDIERMKRLAGIGIK